MLGLKERKSFLYELPVSQPPSFKPGRKATISFLSIILSIIFALSWVHADIHGKLDVKEIVRSCESEIYTVLFGKVTSVSNRYFTSSLDGRPKKVYILCRILKPDRLKKTKCVDSQDCWGMVILNLEPKIMTVYIYNVNPKKAGTLNSSLEYLSRKDGDKGTILEELPTDQVLTEIQKMMSEFNVSNVPE